VVISILYVKTDYRENGEIKQEGRKKGEGRDRRAGSEGRKLKPRFETNIVFQKKKIVVRYNI
jgi:hypothetical protein